MRVLMSGNEAIARGAWEAGVEIAPEHDRCSFQIERAHNEEGRVLLRAYGVSA